MSVPFESTHSRREHPTAARRVNPRTTGGAKRTSSPSARAYFAAGGIGILIGDGRLNYGGETIFETYYALRALASTTLTVDYQHVTDPAYNRDRGPVSIYSVRLHIEH